MLTTQSTAVAPTERAVVAYARGDAVRFAAECAACGAPPANGYRLRGRHVDVRVPLCARCDAQKSRALVVWVVAGVAATGVCLVALALLLELVLPLGDDYATRRSVGMVVALALLAGATLALYALLGRHLGLYHRLRSPVFVLDEKVGVVLAFRNLRFADATRALLAGAGQSYRAGPPAEFVAPRLPRLWPAGLCLASGLGTIGVAVARFVELRAAQGPVRLRSVELVLYELCGAAGVLVLYLLVALVLVLVGGLWLRAVRRTRAQILGV